MENGLAEKSHIATLADAANASALLCESLRQAMALMTAPSSSYRDGEVARQLFAEIGKRYGEIGTLLGRATPFVAAVPFEFTLKTGNYNPAASSDEAEYPEEPTACFTIRIEEAIRVIAGKISPEESGSTYDSRLDVLLESQITGRWMILIRPDGGDEIAHFEFAHDLDERGLRKCEFFIINQREMRARE